MTLADGGDALRHLKVLEGQPELFGDIASAATANRTIIALADDELIVERLADALRAARQRVWDAPRRRTARDHRRPGRRPGRRRRTAW